MKRNFEEMKEPANGAQIAEALENGEDGPLMYGPSYKRRKLDD